MRHFSLILLILAFTAPLQAQETVKIDQLIRSAGLIIAGLILCKSGVTPTKKDDPREGRLYRISRGIMHCGLGLALIVLSSQIVREIDWLLS